MKSIYCPGPQSRRSFLQAGFLGLGGMALGDLLRHRATAANSTPTKDDRPAVILIWLQGGPSHLETYDMKPMAPRDYRGEYNPIPTNVPGIDICEKLPLHAKVADKFTIIRSISHKFANHAGGAGRFLSGRDPLRPLERTAQFPTLPTIIGKLKADDTSGVPPYVASANWVYGGGSAYLGESALPFVVSADPNAENFNVPNLALHPKFQGDRLNDRMSLLTSFDNMKRGVDLKDSASAMDEFNEQAMSILTSDKARTAFDIAQEDDATRDKYGRHKWGQRALLARRLVEAGTTFVTMQMQNPRTTGAAGNWDIHAVNGHLYDDMNGRLPIFDKAVSALVEDIHERGLDKRVMVIVSGEFGRTPRINPQKGTRSGVTQPGRDHWPGAMSVLVSGGGLKMGQVIGSTTAKGEYAKDRKLEPNDLLATVYRHLGVDASQPFYDHTGRPMPILPHGEPIAELL